MSAAPLDTHLRLWAAAGSPCLPRAVRDALDDPAMRPVYSAASLWEVAIKSGLGRKDFRVDAPALRRGLRAGGWEELPIGAPMSSPSRPCRRSLPTRSIGCCWRRRRSEGWRSGPWIPPSRPAERLRRCLKPTSMRDAADILLTNRLT